MTRSRPAAAALAALVILQSVMLLALYAGVPPHPPAAIALSGMGPFLGMALSAAAAALILDPLDGPPGRALTALAAALALVSFGPQKYADPAFGQIWPAVLSAQAAVTVIGHALWRSRKAAR